MRTAYPVRSHARSRIVAEMCGLRPGRGARLLWLTIPTPSTIVTGIASRVPTAQLSVRFFVETSSQHTTHLARPRSTPQPTPTALRLFPRPLTPRSPLSLALLVICRPQSVCFTFISQLRFWLERELRSLSLLAVYNQLIGISEAPRYF